MNRPFALQAFLAGVFLSTWLSPLRAQVAHLESTPPLGDALPLTEAPDGVHLKFPVLLNARTVVEPGSVLRLVYIDPNAGLHLHSGGEMLHPEDGGEPPHHKFNSLSLSPGSSAGSDAFPTDFDSAPNSKKASPDIGSDSWREAQLFRDALNQAADIGTTLVYTVPGKARPGSVAIDLPDGMLLGSPGGRIVVLALASDSEAGRAGLQPQDELRLVNGQPVPGDLQDFSRFYRAAIDQAKTAGQPYSLEVWRPGESRTITLGVGAPPSIPKMF